MEKHSMMNLTNLSDGQFKSFLDSFDTILCDCDGVLVLAQTPIPNADKTISDLKRLGKQFAAVTNNATRRLKNLHGLFTELGFGIEINDIVYPTGAMIHYLNKIKFEKELYVVGCTALKEELKEAGFKVIGCEDGFINENLEDLETCLSNLNKNVGAVIFDYDLNFTYIKLAKAGLYLRRPDVFLIAGGDDPLVAIGANRLVIGTRGFQKTLESFATKQKILLAKPGKEFNKYLVEKLNIKDPSRALFIGDSLTSDIDFANTYGYQTLLVLTGAASLEDAKQCNILPNYYINSIGDIHNLIKKNTLL